MKDIDKYRGCLIGGAAGDALGYAVEFLSYGAIIQKYGPQGITDYDLRDGAAKISDDTQMTLFTATGLLLGTTREMTRGITGSYPSWINFSYQDWYRTQTERYPFSEECHYSWLVNVPELFRRRAPGNTCLSAIENPAYGTIERPINNSKGCGGVTGNILGAYLGLERIPQKYLDNLELKEVILEVADDLYHDCQMTEYGEYYDRTWDEKYIKMTYTPPKD